MGWWVSLLLVLAKNWCPGCCRWLSSPHISDRDSLHLLLFVLCNPQPTSPGYRPSLPVLHQCREAASPGEPRTHSDPPIGTAVQASSCQIWMQIASSSLCLSCVCSHWWYFTQKLGSVSPHISNCYFQPHCPGMAPVLASTVGISKDPLLPSSSGAQSHLRPHKPKSWL